MKNMDLYLKAHLDESDAPEQQLEQGINCRQLIYERIRFRFGFVLLTVTVGSMKRKRVSS